MPPSTIYQDIIDWAHSQQMIEKNQGQEAPVTEAQLKALHALHETLHPPPPEPKRCDVDFVSLLMRYRQAHPDPAQLTLEFVEKAAGGTQVPLWTYHVTLSECPAPFPAVPIPHVRKKDAKQYAAKCAIEWLIAEHRMPDNLRDVKFPKLAVPLSAKQPPTKKQKTADSANGATLPSWLGKTGVPFPYPRPAADTPGLTTVNASVTPKTPTPEIAEVRTSSVAGTIGRAPATGSSGVPTTRPTNGASSSVTTRPRAPDVADTLTATPAGPLPRQPPPGATSPFDADELSAVEQVAQLCKSLAISPPVYKVEEGSTLGFYSGQPEFSAVEYVKIPPGLGRVQDRFGKKFAKEAMAEIVLKYLESVLAQRQQVLRGILTSSRS